MSDTFEDKATSPCSACGTATLPEDLVQVDGDFFCNGCAEEAEAEWEANTPEHVKLGLRTIWSE